MDLIFTKKRSNLKQKQNISLIFSTNYQEVINNLTQKIKKQKNRDSTH